MQLTSLLEPCARLTSSTGDTTVARKGKTKAEAVEQNEELSARVDELQRRHRQCNRAKQRLGRMCEQLRALAARHRTAHESERKSIAGDLHSRLAPALTALKMELSWLEKKIEQPATKPRPALLARIQRMNALVDDGSSTLRQIATAVRPPVLGLGLGEAVGWQAQEFQERTKIPCPFLWRRSARATMEPERTTAVFRIFQQALDHAAHPVPASHVSVVLQEQSRQVTVVVECERPAKHRRFAWEPVGLLEMQERARDFGGTVAVSRAGTVGAVLKLCMPAGTARADRPSTRRRTAKSSGRSGRPGP